MITSSASYKQMRVTLNQHIGKVFASNIYTRCGAVNIPVRSQSSRIQFPSSSSSALIRRPVTSNPFRAPTHFAYRSMSTSTPANNTKPKLPQVFHTIAEVRAMRKKVIQEGGSLGFVPTMGALHAGHVALAARSMKENSHTIVSIFVNPTQFAAHEDLGSYPRTLPADLEALAAIGVPFVFAPNVEEMYPQWPQSLTRVSLTGSDSTSEGSQRPGHFSGVATVVSKLFNIVQPDHAYFGQKDGMQCVVIRRLTKDLDFPVDIRVCPTIRAGDGLALSSRNVYLTPAERAVAPVLFKSLTVANEAYQRGERNSSVLKQLARKVLEAEPMGKFEYVSLADADSGEEIPDGANIQSAVFNSTGDLQQGGAMLSIAYKLGKPRLIDNCILGQELKPGTN